MRGALQKQELGQEGLQKNTSLGTTDLNYSPNKMTYVRWGHFNSNLRPQSQKQTVCGSFFETVSLNLRLFIFNSAPEDAAGQGG